MYVCLSALCSFQCVIIYIRVYREINPGIWYILIASRRFFITTSINRVMIGVRSALGLLWDYHCEFYFYCTGQDHIVIYNCLIVMYFTG